MPLDNEVLDAAVFSLSLMGANFTDYLREAHRCLKLDGHLLIAEATSRFANLEKFCHDLEALGFDLVGKTEERAQFMFIHAIKSGRRAKPTELSFTR